MSMIRWSHCKILLKIISVCVCPSNSEARPLKGYLVTVHGRHIRGLVWLRPGQFTKWAIHPRRLAEKAGCRVLEKLAQTPAHHPVALEGVKCTRKARSA